MEPSTTRARLSSKTEHTRGAKYASGSSLRNTGAGAVLTVKDGLFEEATCAIFNEGPLRHHQRRYVHGYHLQSVQQRYLVIHHPQL